EQKPSASAAPGPSFRDFLRWLAQRDTARGVQHFRALLDGLTDPTPLPLQPIAGRAPSGNTSRAQLRLGAETTAALREGARQLGGTPNTLAQLAWAVLLANYTGHDDVLFGSTWSGRRGTIDGAER